MRRLLWDGPVLPLMAQHQGTWLAGQCWIVAEGLLHWITCSHVFPPPSVFLLCIGDTRCSAHHVTVCIQIDGDTPRETRWYLDANGVSTEADLLHYWQTCERLQGPFLAPYNEHLLHKLGIPRDIALSVRIAKCFLETLGPFSSALLQHTEEA